MRKLWILPLMAVLLVAMLVSAQDAVNLGDTIEDELTAENPRHTYTLTAEAGTSLMLRLESRDFDAYLLLLDSEGNVVAEDDDSGGQLNAELAYTVDASGEYTVVATSVREHASEGAFFASGSYTLTLEGDNAAPEATAEVTEEPSTIFERSDDTESQITGDIVPGGSVEGRLTASSPEQSYTFTAPAGEVITITLMSDDFDAYLNLLDNNGDVLAYDDDGAGDLNSRIGPYAIAAEGTYTIVATSYSGDATGSFTLYMETSNLETVVFGESVRGALDEETPLTAYQLTVEDGDTFVISLETDSYSTYVTVTDTNGTTLRETFGGSEVIGPFFAEEDGGYVITVSTYDTFTASSYTLTAEVITPEALTLNQSLSFEFPENGLRYFTFEATSGDVLNITVESGGTVDTQITLIGPDGLQMMSDDDGGVGFDPELLNIVLDQNGTYALLVQPYIAGDNGQIKLLVQDTGLPSLDEGAQVVRVSEKQFDGVVSFEGVAGERIALSARVLSTGQSDPFITVTQAGETLATNSIGQVERLTIEFTVPEDGVVRVRVEDFSFNPLLIELSMERLGSGE
ncbi:MAG: hypothetical protein OHK0046_16830 [Anaerolineae bacterium]